MAKQWGLTAYLTTPEACAAALKAALAKPTSVPSEFPDAHGPEAWAPALLELEQSRAAPEPVELSSQAQDALLALLAAHARQAGEIICTEQESNGLFGFIGNWLGWLVDPKPNPDRIMPGSFLGWRGSEAVPIGCIPASLVATMPAPRAPGLVARLPAPWCERMLALLQGIRAAAKPGEHAVLMHWVDDGDGAPPAPRADDASPSAEPHYTQSIFWLLHHLVAAGASDLFITGGLRPQVVIDGRYQALDGPVVMPDQVKRIARPVLMDSQLHEVEDRGYMRMSFGLAHVGRMRFTMSQQRGSYLIHIRVIGNSVERWGLADSGYRPDPAPRPGLVLVAGTAGTGRSTTAHAIVEAHAQAGCWRIATIEAPIEGVIPDHRSIVTQHEIGKMEDVRTIALAVEGALDAGAQVVLIDQVDDAERLAAACLLVRAGALVVSTVLGADAEAALGALHASAPAAVGLVQAVIESRWVRDGDGPRRLERATLDGPALAGLRARLEGDAGQPPGR